MNGAAPWAVSLVVVFATGSASADWQYTKWGMSPAQVQAASKGQLQPCDQRCDGHKTATVIPRLVGPYKSGEFSFTAFAIFDPSNKLTKVMLDTKGDVGWAIALALKAKYGEPASQSGSAGFRTQIFRDQKDQIMWLMVGDGPTAHVSLIYQPRLTDSNRGL